jgi:hypothetical protein
MTEPTFKVELTAWEIERIVLGIIQMSGGIPLRSQFLMMMDSYNREIELALKLDKLVRP